jgi:AraC-like DNA-binding protein
MNSSFKKYLPISEIDSKWGFVVNDIGGTIINKGSDYPPKGHPSTYMFSWETGRILDEYHFVFITEGRGIFESKTAGKININPGDGFCLFPGEWHRYKPLKQVGWTENWIGFSGTIPDLIMKEYFFDKKQPLVRKCANIQVMNLLKSTSQLVSEQPYGFQRLASGLCMQLIAEMYNAKQGIKQTDQQNSLISKAKYIIHNQINEHIDFQAMAENMGISYSTFRRDFKRQTGLSPLQYHLLLKIEKAKELLINTELKAKEIAYKLGFDSDYYFCRLFKQKTGISPAQFRAQRRALIK